MNGGDEQPKLGAVYHDDASAPGLVPAFCGACGKPVLDCRCDTSCAASPARSVGQTVRTRHVLVGASVLFGVLALVMTLYAAMRPHDAPGSTVAQGSPGDPGAAHGRDEQPTTPAVEEAPPARLSVSMGPEASLCAATNGHEYTEVWSGNSETTCPFSKNVAAAYRATGPSLDRVVTVSAYSPVTDKDYVLKCEPTNPVRCSAESATATVYIVP